MGSELAIVHHNAACSGSKLHICTAESRQLRVSAPAPSALVARLTGCTIPGSTTGGRPMLFAHVARSRHRGHRLNRWSHVGTQTSSSASVPRQLERQQQ